MTTVFIEPCDVVFFRDDLPFGAPGNQVGRCQFPPRPSVVAGALRSKILAGQLTRVGDLAAGSDVPEVVRREIGGRSGAGFTPGTFRLAALHLGLRTGGGETSYFRAGRDLVRPGKRGQGQGPGRIVRPTAGGMMAGVSSLGHLAPLGVVPGSEPSAGWLDVAAYVRYLAGAPSPEGFVSESRILEWDFRTGIGLDAGARAAAEGRLFSSRGALMRPGWGFVAAVDGCTLLPTGGLIRLGGDGRMARLSPWRETEPDWISVRESVARSGRFRWVLQTPAIFSQGWLPRHVRDTGDGALVYERDGLRARLVSAAFDHPELAGGWDLLRGAPKSFRRMAPAGSVFWWELEDGSADRAWDMFHGRSVSDERDYEGFGLVHLGGW